MLTLAFSMVAYIRAFFGPRHQFALEAAALRQQLAVLKRNQTHLRLHRLDRFFWTALRRVYSGWAEALIIVKPETVVSWHRAGFRFPARYGLTNRSPLRNRSLWEKPVETAAKTWQRRGEGQEFFGGDQMPAAIYFENAKCA
jgi:hypothetical protein